MALKDFKIRNGIIVGGNSSITGTLTATTFSGSGASLTSIPESAISDGSLLARLAANETVTGNWTFSNTISTSISGNAATATKLATSRTINDVIFDGTLAITVPVNNTNDVSTITAVYPLWTSTSDGNYPAKVSTTKLSFIPSTGILTATGFSGSGASLTSIPETAITDGSLLARLAANETISGNWTFSNIVYFAGNALIRFWSNTDTDIDALISGSAFGTLIQGYASGHLTLAINSNENGDGFQVISKISSSSTFNKLCFEVKADGTTTVNGTLTATTFSGSGASLTSIPETAITDGTLLARLAADETVAGTWTFTNTISGNAATATKLATARAINGVNFDGTAAITVPVNNVDDISTITSVYPLWTATAGGNYAAKVSTTKLSFVPSSGILTVGGLVVPNATLQIISGSVLPSPTVADAGKVEFDGSSLYFINSAGSRVQLSSYGTSFTVVNDNASAVPNYITFSAGSSGVQQAKVSSTKLSFVPSTGVLSATSFSGSGASLTSIPEIAIADGTILARVEDNEIIIGAWSFTQTISGNAATATKLATARAINGVDFDGTAAITVPVNNVNDTSSSSSVYPLWTTTSGGNYAAKVSTTKLSFVPSTGTLTATVFSGSGVSLTNIPESAITDGSILARVGSNEIISGSWTFNNTITGSISGNAATATALATARAINGVNFDGTAAITVPVNNADDVATSSSVYPLWTATAGGNYAAKVSTTKLSFVPSTGTLTATVFSGSGASLTNIPESAITDGSILVRYTDTLYVGTTSVALNRASANLALTGISSVTLPGATSGTIQVIPTAVAGTGTVFTLPAVTGTAITTGDTGTVTNTMLAGSIANAKLTYSSVTVGSTAISLGSSATTIAGLTSVTSTTFVGALTGNASTATALATARAINGVNFDGTAAITVPVNNADDVATSSSVYPLWTTTAGGNYAAKVSSTKLSFVPSTGTLSATVFSGSGASLTNIPESAITDGTLLARLAANETVSGSWTFSNPLVINNDFSQNIVTLSTLKNPSGTLYYSQGEIASTSTTKTTYTFSNWNTTATYAAELKFAKSYGSSIGTQTVVASGAILGRTSFYGSDGSNFIRAGFIEFIADAAPTTNIVPGRYRLYLTDSTGVENNYLTVYGDGSFYLNSASVNINSRRGFYCNPTFTNPDVASLTVSQFNNTISDGDITASRTRYGHVAGLTYLEDGINSSASSVTVTAVTGSGTTITFNCAGHTFVAGDWLQLSGSALAGGDGCFKVLSVVANVSVTTLAAYGAWGTSFTAPYGVLKKWHGYSSDVIGVNSQVLGGTSSAPGSFIAVITAHKNTLYDRNWSAYKEANVCENYYDGSNGNYYELLRGLFNNFEVTYTNSYKGNTYETIIGVENRFYNANKTYMGEIYGTKNYFSKIGLSTSTYIGTTYGTYTNFENISNTGTWNTSYIHYGIYSGAGTTLPATKIGWYSSGEAYNIFSGKVRIGDTAVPSNMLEVAGNASITGTLNSGGLILPTATLKITSGTLLASPGIADSGKVEYDGAYIYYIDSSGSRIQLAAAVNDFTVNNDTTSSSANYLTFTAGTSGIQQAKVSSTKLSFVPSTGTLSATVFSGSGASLTNIPESAITDGTLLARLAANETVTGNWTFSNITIGSGTASNFSEWSISNTDIDALITGSTFGTLIGGKPNGHLTLGIDSNDNSDGFQVISKSAGNATYNKLCFEVKADGTTTIGGALTCDYFINSSIDTATSTNGLKQSTRYTNPDTVTGPIGQLFNTLFDNVDLTADRILSGVAAVQYVNITGVKAAEPSVTVTGFSYSSITDGLMTITCGTHSFTAGTWVQLSGNSVSNGVYFIESVVVNTSIRVYIGSPSYATSLQAAATKGVLKKVNTYRTSLRANQFIASTEAGNSNIYVYDYSNIYNRLIPADSYSYNTFNLQLNTIANAAGALNFNVLRGVYNYLNLTTSSSAGTIVRGCYATHNIVQVSDRISMGGIVGTRNLIYMYGSDTSTSIDYTYGTFTEIKNDNVNGRWDQGVLHYGVFNGASSGKPASKIGWYSTGEDYNIFSGKVRIGDTAVPSNMLEVAGNASINGTLSAAGISDTSTITSASTDTQVITKGYLESQPWKDAVRVATCAPLTYCTVTANTITCNNPTITFTSVTSNAITVTSHSFYTGQCIRILPSVQNASNYITVNSVQLIVNDTTSFYIIKIDANTIKLATTVGYAFNGTSTTITVTGTVTGTIQFPIIWNTITLSTGDRILVKDSAGNTGSISTIGNGIYTLTTATQNAWVLTRASDSDTYTDVAGAIVACEEGNYSNNAIFYCSNNSSSGTLGSTGIGYTYISNNTAQWFSTYGILPSQTIYDSGSIFQQPPTASAAAYGYFFRPRLQNQVTITDYYTVYASPEIQDIKGGITSVRNFTAYCNITSPCTYNGQANYYGFLANGTGNTSSTFAWNNVFQFYSVDITNAAGPVYGFYSTVTKNTYAPTFTSATSNAITLTSHSLLHTQPVIITPSVQNTNYITVNGTQLTITNTTTYYVIKVDANTVKLATSAANALAGTSVTITVTGTVTGTITPSNLKWNLCAPGTAPNYLAGSLLIGSNIDDGLNALQVTGIATISTALLIGDIYDDGVNALQVTGDTKLNGILEVVDYTTLNNTLDVVGGTINLINDTSNLIDFENVGTVAPTVSTRSAGTKISLYDTLSSDDLEYSIGIAANVFWFSKPSSASYNWYTGDGVTSAVNNTMQLTNNGLNLNFPSNLGTGLSITAYGYSLTSSTRPLNISYTVKSSAMTVSRTHYPILFDTINQEDGYASYYEIISATWASNNITFYTKVAHGLTAGKSIIITGATPSGYNGTYTIGSVTTYTFVVPKTPDPGTYTSGAVVYLGITGITWTGGNATVTCASHGLSNGNTIDISGVTPSGFNGTLLTVANATTNTFTVAIADPGATYTSGGIIERKHGYLPTYNGLIRFFNASTAGGAGVVSNVTLLYPQIINRAGVSGRSTISQAYAIRPYVENTNGGTITTACGTYNNIVNTSGAITTAYGSLNTITNAAGNTITNNYVTYNQINSSGTTTTADAVRNDIVQSAGTFTTAYGVRNTFTGTIATKVGFYSLGEDYNILSGKLTIGATTVPTDTLEVTGTASITSTLSAAGITDTSTVTIASADTQVINKEYYEASNWKRACDVATICSLGYVTYDGTGKTLTCSNPTITFTSVTSDAITVTGHEFYSGMAIRITPSVQDGSNYITVGGTQLTTSNTTSYNVIVVDANTIKLATSVGLALSNTSSTITVTGTVTGTVRILAHIDGIALAVSHRILVKDGILSGGSVITTRNGIYVATSITINQWVLTRASDWSVSADVIGTIHIPIDQGSLNLDSCWRTTNNGQITLDTTSIGFYPVYTSVSSRLLGIGTVSGVSTLLDNVNTYYIPSAATSFGIIYRPKIQNTQTAAIHYGIYSGPYLNSTTNTVGSLRSFYATGFIDSTCTYTDTVDYYGFMIGNLTESSAETTWGTAYGFYSASITVADTVYLYYGAQASGTGKWNLYMAGTALNYLNGALLIGSASDDGVNKLQVTGGVNVTGTVTAATFSGSGASLTNIPESAITDGSILARYADTLYVGTTSVALNRASANLALTGISSVTLPGATSGTIQVIPTAVAGTGTVFTLPAVTGTAITTGDTGTVTNTMLAGSIANAKLTYSSVTVGSTAISLGGTATTIAGLTSVTSTTFSAAGYATTVQTPAYASTVTPNCASGNVIEIGALTGNIIIGAPTNIPVGSIVVITLTQDSTGNRTVTWNAVFKFGATYTNAVSTAASKVDTFIFYCSSSSVLRCIGKNLGM